MQRQRYQLCTSKLAVSAITNATSIYPTFQTYRNNARNTLDQAKIRHGLLVITPLGERTERTALVGAEEGHAVDVTGVNPTETIQH